MVIEIDKNKVVAGAFSIPLTSNSYLVFKELVVMQGYVPDTCIFSGYDLMNCENSFAERVNYLHSNE